MHSAKALWLIALLVASACAPSPRVSSQQAIEDATRECKTPHLVLVGEPQNIRTRLMTLSEAVQLIVTDAGSTSYARPMNTLVWLVQMDGQLQLVGGPLPPGGRSGQPVPTPLSYFGTCSVVVDANTGEAFVITGGPIGRQPTAKPYP
jgi:hypothetical protein